MNARIFFLILMWSVSAAADAHNVNAARASFGTAGSEYAMQLTCAAPHVVAASSSTLCRLAAAPALAFTASVSWELPASLILAAPYIAAGAGVTAGIVYGLISLLRWLRLHRNDSHVSSFPSSASSPCSGACALAPAPHDPNNKKNKKAEKKTRKQEKKRKKEAQKRCTCKHGKRAGPSIVDRQGKPTTAYYEPNPKHGRTERIENGRVISREPKDGKGALDNSIEVNPLSGERYGISKGELVVLKKTTDTPLVYHGFVNKISEVPDNILRLLRNSKLATMLPSLKK